MAGIRRALRRLMLLVAVLIPLSLGGLAVALSHDSPCGAPAVAPADGTGMKALVYRCYGGPEVLRIEQVPKPVPADDQLLVRVHAASVNPLDWHYMRGEPYVMRLDAGFGRPTDPMMGVDFAGTVETVGKAVTRFHPGDEVFGARGGALAEYVAVRESRAVTMKPAAISFEQAAAVPVAAVTALQALRDEGKLQAGQSVLINGASGGVGTYAVQLARHFGAEVTGVCSTKNIELVRSLGADHAIDYTKENFTEGPQRYDLIVDMVGSQGLLEYRRVLQPEGRLVIVGGPPGAWVGALAAPIRAFFLEPFVHQPMNFFIAQVSQADLELLAGLMQQGKLTSVIDRTYALADAAQAMEYLEQGHARGKVIVTVEANEHAGR